MNALSGNITLGEALKDSEFRSIIDGSISELKEELLGFEADESAEKKQKVEDLLKELGHVMASIEFVNIGEEQAKKYIKKNLANGKVSHWNFCLETGNVAYQDEDGLHIIDPRLCIDKSGILIK